MPYEKNKTAYQDEEWFESEQRNVLDVLNWNRDLTWQTFYQLCHTNKIPTVHPDTFLIQDLSYNQRSKED